MTKTCPGCGAPRASKYRECDWCGRPGETRPVDDWDVEVRSPYDGGNHTTSTCLTMCF